jgi:hypothetical protein
MKGAIEKLVVTKLVKKTLPFMELEVHYRAEKGSPSGPHSKT